MASRTRVLDKTSPNMKEAYAQLVKEGWTYSHKKGDKLYFEKPEDHMLHIDRPILLMILLLVLSASFLLLGLLVFR